MIKCSVLMSSSLFLALLILMCGLLMGAPEERNVETPRSYFCNGLAPGPIVVSQKGDTVWVKPHRDSSACPGDPGGGHGGEATGGPDGSETWCFEQFDSCGTAQPWDVTCFEHIGGVVDCPMNFWHVDSYRADQQPYCGNYVLWCGTDSMSTSVLWDCATLRTAPGYGNDWNCVAEMRIPKGFTLGGPCSLMFDVRYDTECKYDYLYLEFLCRGGWDTLATFNATSNYPGPECGASTGGNPDYWANSEADNPYDCNWQQRQFPGIPAFCTWLGDSLYKAFVGIEVSPSLRPLRRVCHSMAYDKARNRVVLFGGVTGGLYGIILDDTWEWDGTSWIPRSPQQHPQAREGAAMVYDEADSQVILFGGICYDSVYSVCNDTWAWDGSNWTQLDPDTSPPPRYMHAMAYDKKRERIVLFGGTDSTGCQQLSDTWEWDGSDWHFRTWGEPAPRCFYNSTGLAYDPVRGVTVLFGGLQFFIIDGDTIVVYFFDDTWEWDGVQWTELSPLHHPHAREGHALAYCPTLGSVVLFGGNYWDVFFANDIWDWNGSDWEEISIESPPPGRTWHTMVYSPVDTALIVFGGLPNWYDPAFDDTWKIDGGAVLDFRWHFVSDWQNSDEDGVNNTDGAAFIDNIWVTSATDTFFEDFESGFADSAWWEFPPPELTNTYDGWHLVHDPDPPYEGGDGGERTTCLLDSSVQWRARPEGGFPPGTPWRNGWHYRLMTPPVPLENSGCVVQYDMYLCLLDYTHDYATMKVRVHNVDTQSWSQWQNVDGSLWSGCEDVWDIDKQDDVSSFYSADDDSIQFAWDLIDGSYRGDASWGKHKSTDLIIDNVSVGFYDLNSTIFQMPACAMLQDTFEEALPLFNSFFNVYDPDTLSYYEGPPYNPLPVEYQLYLLVTDKDNVNDVRLYGSIDGGVTWLYVTMDKQWDYDPEHPELGGLYTGTFYPTDFSLGRWLNGTELYYAILSEDGSGNWEYFPRSADPSHPDHTGTHEDYFTVSIMPMFAGTTTAPKILLVDGYGRRNYDYAPCMASIENLKPLEDIYEKTLRDAGYCYDKFDISGAGSNIHIHPIEYADYDAVVWFTGPSFSNYLFDAEAQRALKQYLTNGGKVVLCGDRIAYNMAVVGEDSLGGEFLSGIMGCTYQGEMESAFAKPYIYLQAAPSVSIFGSPKTINPTFLDLLVIYRECPYLKDMSYVVTNTAPPGGYWAQPLLYVLNPDPEYDPADGAVYVEVLDSGQCVFINYDLCAFVNHTGTWCNGSAPPGMPTFAAGYYYGRAELMRTILEELFGLQSYGWGGGGPSSVDRKTTFHWALSQNTPNPMTASTNIRFEVARTSDVSIKVYNAMGQLVKTLKNQRLEPGRYSVHWDGTNASGQRVSSGIYFYRMVSPQFSATRKIVLVQ